MPSLTTVSATLGTLAFAFLTPAPAVAADPRQDGPDNTLPAEIDENTDTLTARLELPPTDGQLADQACRDAADASNGGHSGTIVACFHGAENDDQRITHANAEDTGTRTGAAYPPNVDTLPGCLAMCITIPFGRVPEPVYYIDLAAIPEAPVGTDAWKIAKGVQREP